MIFFLLFITQHLFNKQGVVNVLVKQKMSFLYIEILIICWFIWWYVFQMLVGFFFCWAKAWMENLNDKTASLYAHKCFVNSQNLFTFEQSFNAKSGQSPAKKWVHLDPSLYSLFKNIFFIKFWIILTSVYTKQVNFFNLALPHFK